MGKITDLENIAALKNKHKFVEIVNKFCGGVCTHLIQDRGLFARFQDVENRMLLLLQNIFADIIWYSVRV